VADKNLRVQKSLEEQRRRSSAGSERVAQGASPEVESRG
jgi:hypothetical protein